MVIASLIGLISLFVKPTVTAGLMVRRLGLIGLVVYQLKSEIDGGLVSPAYNKSLHNCIAIVTGANSGTGFAISQRLALLNATVIMGCRSERKCNESAQSIISIISNDKSNVGSVVPMIIDLEDLDSVKSFANTIKKKYQRVDFLINNAGLVPQEGARTVQGLETSFGVMHLGHFALTKWLLELMQKPLPKQLLNVPHSSRVVYVGSEAYLHGKLPDSMMYGNGSGDLRGEITDNCPFKAYGFLPCCPRFACPYTNGYSRAKLANILTVFELQRRSDSSSFRNKRRIVTSVLHPGVVTTNIQWFLSSTSPVHHFLRTSDQAAEVILHAIVSDDFVPSSFIDAMKYSHDLLGFKQKYLSNHLSVFPVASNLSFAQKSFEINSFELWHWNRTSLLYTANHTGAIDSTLFKIPADTIAARLYDLSEQLVSDFDRKKLLFSTNVLTSKA
eukprot:gene17278-22812_t